MLPSECPNCGRQHPECSFIDNPGPVQEHLLAVSAALVRLLEEYEEDRSDSVSEGANDALRAAEEAGLITMEVVVKVGSLNPAAEES